MQTHCGPDGCTEDDMLLAQHAPIFARHFQRVGTREGL
jgi:hypothetical protein